MIEYLKKTKDSIMKKHAIAILGFGIVGNGIANLVTKNKNELAAYLGCEIEIKHILDLRDFPSSPFAGLVTHSFEDIVNDAEVKTVIEAMGGSHPAYEYTVAALKAGKNVVTSNKEVVANFGDEFVRLAKENSVSYRFEGAVGGGIPVIAPMLASIRQNKTVEVRGILNGTTNYILTKMFTYGDSFESALADAQAKGYAEKNPDADILGLDAARKITILTALGFDMLMPVEKIPTEGITNIRKNDVLAAEKIGCKIKLLGRAIANPGKAPFVMVAPFLLSQDSPLSTVNGVYNAVEVVAEPLGNVMFYGQGAGAGATASAVVGDLIPIIAYNGYCPIVPGFNKTSVSPKEYFDAFVARSYVATAGVDKKVITELFGEVTFIDSEEEVAFITPALSENAVEEKLACLGAPVLSRIRFL